jgi:hypothetical protein
MRVGVFSAETTAADVERILETIIHFARRIGWCACGGATSW